MVEKLHKLVEANDLDGVRELLRKADKPKKLVNDTGSDGKSALFIAVGSSTISLELIELLLDTGANIGVEKLGSIGERDLREPLLREAVRGQRVEVLDLLLSRGADFNYRGRKNESAIRDAVYGYGDRLPTLRYLLGLGLEVSVITAYETTAASEAYDIGRFDVLQFLLREGADEKHIEWTPLHRAVAIGSVTDLDLAIAQAEDLNAYDKNGRTPIHVALIRGDWVVVEMLVGSGANLYKRSSRGEPSISFAGDAGHLELVNKLIELGCTRDDLAVAIEDADWYENVPLMKALLKSGIDIRSIKPDFSSLLGKSGSREMSLLLIENGADIQDLADDAEGRRTLLGLADTEEAAFETVTRANYLACRYNLPVTHNPQVITDRFKLAMVQSGWNGYKARKHFDDLDHYSGSPAVWSFQRFGQSTTMLPDGRVVLIAGQHEDYYDPDFCIYNDVTVFEPNGKITIYGYPEDIFPPTDSHSATLVGDWIYIIGSIGYVGTRKGKVPVYRLNIKNFKIESVQTLGDVPNRFYDHRAYLVDGNSIFVEGGEDVVFDGDKEEYVERTSTLLLNLETLTWS